MQTKLYSSSIQIQCYPKDKGRGGVSFDKNKNHGLEMHFKAFEVFLVYVSRQFDCSVNPVLPYEILSSQRVGSFHL